MNSEPSTGRRSRDEVPVTWRNDEATRVDTLSADEASRHRHALASDRAWLSAFQWSTVR